MKILTGILMAIVGIAIVVLAIVAKLSWLAVAIAFVLALIGIAGVTMALVWTILWIALKISIAWIILLVIAKVCLIGESK